MCGKQIVLFFGQETVVVVETCEILLFFQKGAVIVEETFWNTTVHPVNIHIIRPNGRKTHARCKSGRSGQRG